MEKEKPSSKTITIAGREIKCEIRNVDIFKLNYSTRNPRVNSILSSYEGKVTQEIIEEKLWGLDSTKDLFRDIWKNKGLIEEIIVKGSEVLEGNSRLCSYRHAYNKATKPEEKETWRFIRARILPEDITEEEIFIILGTFHIKGKAKWRTYEQASYLAKMINEFGKSPKEISEMIGINEVEIKRMIESYDAMNCGGVKDLEKFSYFLEYFKNRKLEKLREENPYLTNDFIRLIKEERIPEAQKVRDLPLIMSDKKAKRAFVDLGEDWETALNIAHKRHPEAESSFYANIKKTTKILQNARIQRIKEEIEENKSRKYVVKNLIKEVKRFCCNLGLKF